MRNFIAAVLVVVFGAIAFAADSYLIQFKFDDQTEKRMKIIDNGDGTFSRAVNATASVLSGKTYALHSKKILSPDSLTFNGIGFSWAFAVIGGSATFTVNGSSPTIAFAGQTFGSEFRVNPTNPVIDVTELEAGATVQISIDGGV